MLTSWPSLQTDIRNAGATWVDKEVVVCESGPNTLVTSRKPQDLPAFRVRCPGACRVAFGTAGPVVPRRLMAHAAASLLSPGRYASDVLAGSARPPVLHIPFDYVSLAELGSVAGTFAVGAGLA